MVGSIVDGSYSISKSAGRRSTTVARLSTTSRRSTDLTVTVTVTTTVTVTVTTTATETVTTTSTTTNQLQLTIGVFHSGSLIWSLMSPESGSYPYWQQIKEHIKYCIVQFYADLNDDGSLTPTAPIHFPLEWGCEGTDFDNLMLYCQEIIRNGFYPIIDLFLDNFETVTESGLRVFLANWSINLGENKVIWVPCWEYNQVKAPGWGTGSSRSYRIEPTDFNRVMMMIRKVRDDLRIGNILLGAYPLLWPLDSWDYAQYGDRLYEDWLPGMRMADILGVSSYNAKIDEAWEEARRLYYCINQPEKPFFFFEYANDYPQTGSVVTAGFVNDSYAEIPSHSFVKVIIWWHGTKYTPETIEAIGINAASYEG